MGDRKELKKNNMRDIILKHFEPIVGIVPDEKEKFFVVCDLWEFCELTYNIEKELKIELKDRHKKYEYCFDTVKDFVDWVIQSIV